MKKNKGFFSSLIDFIWLLIVAAIVYGFVKVNNIHDIDSFINASRLKSYEVRACLGNMSKLDPSVKCNLKLKVGLDDDYKPPKSDEDKPVSSVLNPKDKDNNSEQEDNNSNVETSDTPVTDKLSPGKVDKYIESMNTLPATKIDKATMLKMLDELKIMELDNNVFYNRADWKHWKQDQSRCWNVREEVLYRQGKDIKLLDRNKKLTSNKKEACYIQEGLWLSPYDNKKMDRPSQVDVDHHYPLGRAAKMGGDKFTKEQKEQFANDFENLVAISNSSNRSKGSRGPGEWMPENKKSHCPYAKIYINISKKYDLGITKEDYNALSKAIASCEF